MGKKIKKADQALFEGDFKEALPLYVQIGLEEPYNYNAQYKAEVCSLFTNWRDKSIDKLVELSEKVGDKDHFYYYWLGRALARQWLFEQAIEAWKTFLSTKGFKSNEIVEETREYIRWAKRVQYFHEHPVLYEVELLDDRINTDHAEVSPVWFDDRSELLYMSSRSINALGHQDFPFHAYEAIYEGGKWLPPQLALRIGDFSEKNANMEVVNNDGKLFIYRDEFGGDLFYSEYHENRWIEPVEFDEKMRGAEIESHFFISEAEDQIIFSSDKKSKNGSLDLFVSNKRTDGKWSKAKPLDYLLNTEKDEDSPYLTPDGKKLYFSSKGHNAIGGYDIFVSTYNEEMNHWGIPENLGFPINSVDDELYFKYNKDMKNGYFVSNRIHGMGDYDIYHFWHVIPIDAEGLLVDLGTKEPVAFAQLKFHPTKYLDETIDAFADHNGRYNVQLISDETFKVEIYINHHLVFEDFLDTHNSKGSDLAVHKDFGLDHFRLNAALTNDDYYQINHFSSALAMASDVDFTVTHQYTDIDLLGSRFADANKAVLKNVYFDSNTAVLQSRSEPALNLLIQTLQQHPELKIEISGHTDQAVGPQNNLILSEERAKSVSTYLVEKGIAPTRLRTKGYGEKQPLNIIEQESGTTKIMNRIEVALIK